jgi:hypothetical protein
MKYSFLVLCLIILCSCEQEPQEPLIGECPYPTKLSKYNLSFSAEGGIDTVVAGNAHWWLYGSASPICKNIGVGNEDYCNDNYCNNLDLTMKIECSWFSVTRINEYTLLVSVDENNANEEKNTGVTVQDGNCYSGFSITQAPKSPRELWVNAKGGIDSATTEGEWRYIGGRLTVGDTVMVFARNRIACSMTPFLCTDGLPFITDEGGVIGIEHSWFTVDKPDKKKVRFSVSENITGKNRKFGIRLEAEDYYTNIWVNQSAE